MRKEYKLLQLALYLAKYAVCISTMYYSGNMIYLRYDPSYQPPQSPKKKYASHIWQLVTN